MSSSFSANAHHGQSQIVPKQNFKNNIRNKQNLELKVSKMAQRLSSLVDQNAYSMNKNQLKDLKKAIRKAIQIAKGQVIPTGLQNPFPPSHGGGQFPPQNGGGQFPPMNMGYVCADDQSDFSMDTFRKVKAFAYAGNGLNKTSSAATQMTQKWMQKYPCGYADEYIAKFKKLNTFAYGGNGMNMTSTPAKNFALKKVDSFCADYPLQSEFKKFYNFAYSSSGMNMTSTPAKKYALKKISQYAFNCQVQF